METPLQLANRFREVYLNGEWVVYTNYKAQLSETPREILTKEIEDLNTIESIAFHIHYYVHGVLNVLEGGTLDISDKYSFDFPPTKSEEEWKSFLTTFINDCEKFAEVIENMSDEDLDGDFSENKYGSKRKNINALIEHGYYHLGQIILIKKLVNKNL
ncbi:hypothetical protein CHRYSEOSP005_23630 [Chryseobacterium sp. Alg-005]|uniref:DinB family protein n=1 Tax=Chryseobacterium sp. Alg-005 TaxID=3159516 RepID=UPI003555817D